MKPLKGDSPNLCFNVLSGVRRLVLQGCGLRREVIITQGLHVFKCRFGQQKGHLYGVMQIPANPKRWPCLIVCYLLKFRLIAYNTQPTISGKTDAISTQKVSVKTPVVNKNANTVNKTSDKALTFFIFTKHKYALLNCSGLFLLNYVVGPTFNNACCRNKSELGFSLKFGNTQRAAIAHG